MIKLHLFSGFENSRLGITRDTRLGHLYSDCCIHELKEAAKRLGINPEYLQNSRGFYHYDLWGRPLAEACLLYKIVDNHELYRDLKAIQLSSGQEIGVEQITSEQTPENREYSESKGKPDWE